MFELVVIWSNGTKNVFSYKSKEEAEQAEQGMKTALGNQIEWTGVREKEVMSEAAKEARRAYYRDWNKKHPDNVKEKKRRYWKKKAAEANSTSW